MATTRVTEESKNCWNSISLSCPCSKSKAVDRSIWNLWIQIFTVAYIGGSESLRSLGSFFREIREDVI